MPDYKNGQIYKIVNSENDIVYVGSTCNGIDKRFSSHISESRARRMNFSIYEAMREIGSNKFKIKLICNYPCTSRKELEAKEYKVMNNMIEDGIELYNDRIDGKLTEEAQARIIRHHNSTNPSIKKTIENRAKCSEETKAKISRANTGRKHSEEAKANMSRGKMGHKTTASTRKKLSQARMKRGTVYFNKRSNHWGFRWADKPGLQKCKSFSIREYGDLDKAEQAAIAMQDKMYPK